MFTKSAHLKNKIISSDVEMAGTRDGFGTGVVEAGEKNENIMVLSGDLTDSTRSNAFKEKFPERFLQVGIAEQNMLTLGVGLSFQGKIPFLTSYAVFMPGRCWDQTRISGCYNDANIKIMGGHSGISVGPDGATHQAMEDIAIMRVLPRMKVFVPCDAEEARKIVHEAAKLKGPVYMRYGRAPSPLFTSEKTPFSVGKVQTFRDGNDVAIIGAGQLVHAALVAADRLTEKGIKCRVVNSPSIKPLDEDGIEKAAKECGAVVTVEEHQITGGVGSAIAEFLVKHYPVPMEFIGMRDSFGESGKPEELLKKYKMDANAIEEAVLKVIKRKR